MINISASLVTYNNSKEEIKPLLESLKVKTIVVDNSRQDTLREVCASIENVTYIFSNANLGFGTAHNNGIKYLKEQGELGEFHLIVSPDITFDDSAIDTLTQYLHDNPDVGLVSPKLLDPDGSLQPQCRILPTPIDLMARRALPGKFAEQFNARHEMHASGYDKIFTVPFIQASCWLIRSEIFDTAGYFDERFFLYMEDIDFCRRVNEVSRVVFYPEVSVTHPWNKGSRSNWKMLKLHVRSMVKYYNKWGWFFDKKRRALNKKVLSQF